MNRVEHFELESPGAASLRINTGDQLRVRQGRLWITVQDAGGDIWLRAGEHWQAEAPSLVWLSAEPAARFELVHPVSLPARHRGQGVRSWAQWGRWGQWVKALLRIARPGRHRPT